MDKIRMARPRRTISMRRLLREPTRALDEIATGASQRHRPDMDPVEEEPEEDLLAGLPYEITPLMRTILFKAEEGSLKIDSIARTTGATAQAVGTSFGFLELDGLLVRCLEGYRLSRLGQAAARQLKKAQNETL
jgi:hypothetical protein